MRRLLASLALPWLVSCAWDPGPEGAESPILVDPPAAFDLTSVDDPVAGGAGAVGGPAVLGIEARVSVACSLPGEPFDLAAGETWRSQEARCGIVAASCWTAPGELARSWLWAVACP